MKISFAISCALGALVTFSAISARAQSLPGTLSFTTSGSFVNGLPANPESILIADNDLTDGYAPGMDTTDAPASLNPIGTAGSAAFQWGVASNHGEYSHTSALWFEPLAVTNAAPGEFFDLGYLYYRNGTIRHDSGASWVDLALTLSFSTPSEMEAIAVTFGSDLINTVNTHDEVASADVVSLRDLAAPINFTDSQGNQYFLELTFRVDQDTIDGTLSTPGEFRVFEGDQGRAELVGRFTTMPAVLPVPEPSAALLAAIGALGLLRRSRKNA